MQGLNEDEQIRQAKTLADDDLLHVPDRRRARRSRNARKFDAAQSAPPVQADVKGKGRALLQRDVVCGYGEPVAEEELNPIIWRNLPSEILNLVLDHVPQMQLYFQLAKNVARNLNQGSCVMSMDFHPMQQSVLLGMYVHEGSSKLMLCQIVLFSEPDHCLSLIKQTCYLLYLPVRNSEIRQE